MPNPYRPGHRTNQSTATLWQETRKLDVPTIQARRRAIKKYRRPGRRGMTRAVQTNRYKLGLGHLFRKLLGW